MRDFFWEDVKIVMLGIGITGAGLSLLAWDIRTLSWSGSVSVTVCGLVLTFVGVHLYISDHRRPQADLDQALEEETALDRDRIDGIKTRTIVVVKVKCRACGVLNKEGAETCSSCGSRL